MPADLYDVLGAAHDAAAEEIKRAYRDRVREYHPDVNDHPDSDAQFKLIRTAHDVLSNPAERKTYDRLGHREYVEKNLDNLPPVSVFPDEDLPDDVSTAETEPGTESSSTGRTTTDTASRTSTSTTANTTSSTGRANSSRSDTRTGTDTATDRSSTGRRSDGRDESSTEATTSGASAATTDTTSQTSDQESTSTGSDASSWDAATNSAQSATSSSTVPAGVRRRRGLKRWYGVVALSLFVYLGGLGIYALPRQAALRNAVADAVAAPVSTLLGPFPLESPAAYLLTAVQTMQAGTPALGGVLLAGAVLLPLVVLTTVGRFGRGAAWMYAVPSLGPAVTLAIWPVVAVPTWAALVGLILLPVLSGGGFLVDVGRYLRATR